MRERAGIFLAFGPNGRPRRESVGLEDYTRRIALNALQPPISAPFVNCEGSPDLRNSRPDVRQTAQDNLPDR